MYATHVFLGHRCFVNMSTVAPRQNFKYENALDCDISLFLLNVQIALKFLNLQLF